MTERKAPGVCRLIRFDGWDVRIYERVSYDTEGNPQYTYEPNLKRKETRGYFVRFVGNDTTHNYKKFRLAGPPDVPMIFSNPDEAFYAAIAAAWRWRVEVQRDYDTRIM